MLDETVLDRDEGDTTMHDNGKKRLGKAEIGRAEGHGGMLLLCALLVQSATAQQTVTTTYGIDMEIPDTTIELKWLKAETKEFYPSKKKYEADVETLLKNPPICLDTDTYCRTTKSSERGINLGIAWKEKKTLPSTMQRPHEDPRVVENWKRQRRIQAGLPIIESLISGDSSSFARWLNPSEPMGVGGDQ